MAGIPLKFVLRELERRGNVSFSDEKQTKLALEKLFSIRKTFLAIEKVATRLGKRIYDYNPSKQWKAGTKSKLVNDIKKVIGETGVASDIVKDYSVAIREIQG